MIIEETLLNNEEHWFNELLRIYGPLGVFIVSLLGNAIPYSTIPYLVLIVVYAGTLNNFWEQLVVTIAGGLGAALGKVIVYYFGYGLRLVLTEEQRRNLEIFVSLFKRSTFLAVFLFATLPLPDDILYIPLGASKYSITRYTIALVMGKIIITGAAVFFGSSLSWFLKSTTDLPWYITVIVLLYISLWLTYLVSKINWINIAKTYKEKGVINGTIKLLITSIRETVNFLLLPYNYLKKRL